MILFSCIAYLIAFNADAQVELVPLRANQSVKSHAESLNSFEVKVLAAAKRSERVVELEFSPNADESFILNYEEHPYLLDATDIQFSPALKIRKEDKGLVLEGLTSERGSVLIKDKNGQEKVIVIKRSGRMLPLPFIEDFSAEGPYPSSQRWDDNYVYVNYTYGVDPVSLGVASFDGIDHTGAPYGGGFGPSDTLTSREINLLGANPNDLYLTFYIQPGGLSFRPESEDSLILQFKDAIDRWTTVAGYIIDDYPELDSFYFISQPVNASFFHGAFQFRFVNYSDNEGVTDVWNVDYIKLAEEFGSNFQRETDLALTLPPDPLLKSYRAMPWRHFRGFERDELDSFYTVELFNHNNVRMQADSSFLAVVDVSSSRLPLNETLLELPPVVEENQRDLDPGRHRFTNEIKTDDFVERFENLFNDDEENLTLQKAYAFRQVQTGPNALRRNKLSFTSLNFSNYFAYDDGSAESGIQFNFGSSGRPALAVQFHTNVDDSIAAIQCMFPHTTDSDRSQEFRFAIWGTDINAGAIYESATMNPVFVHEELGVDSIQGVTTYKLKSSLTGNDTVIAVDKGIFYLGWIQISSGSRGVQVGFDLNTPDAADKNFYFNGAQWVSLQSVSPFFEGTPIIRPVTAPYNGTPTPIIEVDYPEEPWSLFPNPASDFINIIWDGPELFNPGKYFLYNASGQLLKKGIWNGDLNISNYPPGNYWLNLWDKSGKNLGTRSLIISNN
jgi:hypothetical protein